MLAIVHCLDSTNHDQMRHDLFDLGKTAVEYRGRTSQHRSAGDELGPFGPGKSFAEMRPVRPAKIFARSSCAAVRVLMQNTPFSIILAAEGEDLLMQNNIMGGSTVIDATEVAVIPPSLPVRRW